MSSISEYFKSLGTGIVSLVKGLQVTGKELVTPKITEFYPEDRETYKWPERFRARLELIYDAEGRHRCIACGTCERVCPNGTISLDIKTVESPDGKRKKKLAVYHYDLGTCTFCDLCVTNCPTTALQFSNDFEQAMFTRDKLRKVLNDRPDRQEDATWAEASAAPAPVATPKPGAPVADDAAAKKIEALKKALAAKEAALAAAADDAEKAKIQAIIDKTKAAIAAMAPANAVDPAKAKKIEALKKALAAKEAALAAAADDAEKAKIQAIIDKTKAAIAALDA